MADKRFFSKINSLTLAQIVEKTGCHVVGDGQDLEITDILPLLEAGAGHVTFLSNVKYANDLVDSKASACFMVEKFVEKAPKGMVCLVSKNPHKAYAIATRLFYSQAQKLEETKIHPTAIISDSAKIGGHVEIGPYAVIEDDVMVGNNSFIGAHTQIGKGCEIGEGATIHGQASLSHCLIGQNVTIFPGVRIGQSGFGYAMDPSGHVPVPQLGRVVIGSYVEIGANSTIDRGSWKDTQIGDGCIIDNLVMIAHNVVLGRGCVIVGQAGIAGSTTFGDFVVAGGQSGFGGHINIGSGVQVGAQAGVTQDIPAGEHVNGTPALPLKKALRQSILLKKLAYNELSLVKTIKKEK